MWCWDKFVLIFLIYFKFGGKLVSFESSGSSTQQPSSKNVYISQVVTETELLGSSAQLEQALLNGQYVEFCAMKSANSSDEIQENIWNFLRVIYLLLIVDLNNVEIWSLNII